MNISSKDVSNLIPNFTFNDFISHDISDLVISVSKINDSILTTTYEVSLYIVSKELLYTISKRYTEFAGLYDIITMKYKNFNFPEFPSKIQLFKKLETRRKYFDIFIRTVLNIGQSHKEIKKDIMKILYEFLFPAHESKKDLFKSQRRSSFDNTNLEKSFETFPLEENKTTIVKEQYISNPEEHSKDGWNIEYKLENNEFIKGFLKIQNQVLFIHDSVISNNFYLLTPLYKIQYEIYKSFPIDSSKTLPVDEQELKKIIEGNCSKKLNEINYELLIFLNHDYDTTKFIIKFNRTYNLSVFSNFLQNLNNLTKLRPNEPTVFIEEIDESNINIYGKFYLKLVDISIKNFEGNVYAKLSINPYTFRSKNVLSKSHFKFDQIFLIPIHNKFDILLIEFFSQSNSTFFQNKVGSDKFGEYKLVLPHFINLINPYKKTFEVEIDIKDYDILSSKEFEHVEKKIILNFRFENFSSLSSLFQRTNKSVCEEMVFNKSEDLNIKILLKRLIRFLLLIKQFKIRYKEIFYWKYPNFSLFLLVALNLYTFYSNLENILVHILIFLGVIIFYYSWINEMYLKEYVDEFLFKRFNNFYFKSELKLKDEEEDEEAKSLNYLSEKNKKKTNFLNSVIEPIKKFKDYKNTYHKVLYKFTKIISFWEKLKNLFFWTDPLITFCIMLLIVVLILIIYNIHLKVLLFFWYWENFISGFNYYEKKYINNVEIGRIVLKAGHTEWSQETKNKKKDITFIDTDIDKIIIFDEKYRTFIKNYVEKNLRVAIPDEFMNGIVNLGELHDCIGKCMHMLKIKKDNHLYSQVKDNMLIYHKNLNAEDIIYDFVFNIKSDYYIAKYDLTY